tara:strand:- start:262 stop:708 length:447 start_codon:yes stop_codon:yes gene_type:complete
MAIHEKEPRPKIDTTTWQQLYLLTGHWKSDMQFYNDDLRFLRHLIDKYFLWIAKKENLDAVRDIEVTLIDISKKCDNLLKKIEQHFKDLSHFIDKPDIENMAKLELDHARLEKRMADFVKSFRENRKEVFKITSYVIDSEQLSKIMER